MDNSSAASAKATQSGIKTRGTPDGNSENYKELRFEDRNGHEVFYLHAERNLVTSAKSCETHSVGVDKTITVVHDRLITLGRDEKKKASGTQDLHVAEHSFTTIDGGVRLPM